MKKVKVCYIRTQFWFNLKSGGSVGHTLGILNAFIRNNCELLILSNEKFIGIEKFNFRVIKPKFFTNKFKRIGEFLFNFYSYNSIRKEIIKYKPDFIYHRYSGMTFFIGKLANSLNIPLVLEFNSFDTWKIKYWSQNSSFIKKIVDRLFFLNLINIIELYNLKCASVVVAVSEVLKSDLLKKNISEGKILVNPNGVDTDKFNNNLEYSEKCKELRIRLGVGENKTIVGFSGTFGQWHGIPQLKQSIIEIVKNKLCRDMVFLLIGDGLLKPSLERDVGIYDNVFFVGEISYEEVEYYLSICDVLVSPHCPQIDGKEFFGSPTKLFEYMALGKGIVASNMGQISNVLENNKTAILVEPGNVEQLTNGILKLAINPSLRKELGKNAREEVLKKYTWNRNIKNLSLFVDEKIDIT
jgi:glycosyltransferase involved in cell wall biosynthesis